MIPKSRKCINDWSVIDPSQEGRTQVPWSIIDLFIDYAIPNEGYEYVKSKR